MLYVGTDWSEGNHNLCFINESGAPVSEIEFPHTAQGFEKVEVERLREVKETPFTQKPNSPQ